MQQELTNRGIESIAPKFPTPEGQNLNAWLETLTEVAGEVGSRDILVGHSTGAIFFVNVLNQLLESVKATFLVDGFIRANGNPKYDALNSTFLEVDI